jgi:hypothetical protein
VIRPKGTERGAAIGRVSGDAYFRNARVLWFLLNFVGACRRSALLPDV